MKKVLFRKIKPINHTYYRPFFKTGYDLMLVYIMMLIRINHISLSYEQSVVYFDK